MTEKQAIKIRSVFCNRIPQEELYTKLTDELAIEIDNAITKQVPKKPTPHRVDIDKIKIGNANWCKGTTVYKCPCCNDFISRIYDYCYKCGQALDWSDNDESTKKS